MKVFNPVSSGKASGRALGGVFSFNRGLPTFKRYVKSYNPNTEAQQTIKSRFSFLTKYWKTYLTYDQILLWQNWNLPWWDIYGTPVSLTGMNKFIICNATLLEAEKDITLIPPTATPSELDITATIDPQYIKISIAGIPDAEVNAQDSFVRVQVPGIPTAEQYVDRQLGLFWDGMPRSRVPLEKNWKTIYFYDHQTSYNGIEEFKIVIQTNISLVGLQPIRIQRFNKFGYWSGRETYINPITGKNLCPNGDFWTDQEWTWGGAWAHLDGRAFVDGDGVLRQDFPTLINCHTYRFTWSTMIPNPDNWIALRWNNVEKQRKTTTGTWYWDQHKDVGEDKLEFQHDGLRDCWIDDIFIRDIT